jgi:DNA-binding response OmpR family regulator
LGRADLDHGRCAAFLDDADEDLVLLALSDRGKSSVGPLLVYPEPPPPLVVQALDLASYRWKAAVNASVAAQLEPVEGWAGAVVSAEVDPQEAFVICRALRKRALPVSPVVVLVVGSHLDDLEVRADLFDDFCLIPFRPKELETRLRLLSWRAERTNGPEVVQSGDLVINLETHQAAVAGRLLKLTYMEHELLKFFATHPGTVFTRQTLLSQVWDFEHYGGPRTVDVHVRRLRAALGDEHAGWIQTIRSVGYRFSQSR